MTSPSSLLRVLCLHDAGSNSMELSQAMDSLGTQLYQKHGIDLVFVDAPLIVKDSVGSGFDSNSNFDSTSNSTSNFGSTSASNSNFDSDSSRRDCKSNDPVRPRNTFRDHPPRAWWETTTEIETVLFPHSSGTRDGSERDSNSGSDEMDLHVPPVGSNDANENGYEPIAEDEDIRDETATETTGKAPSASTSTSPPPHYVGLDASLLLLRQVWASSPFWGILAVGQAAGVAALLPLLPGNGNGNSHQIPPAFLIFVHGGSLLGEEEPLTDPLELPCLHIVDDRLLATSTATTTATATLSGAESTKRLIHQFGGTVVSDRSLSSSSSSSSCSASALASPSVAFNNHVGRFLVARKRELRSSASGSAVHEDAKASEAKARVLALQHALHQTETEASLLVAKHIAANPPDALMAVITPRGDVGGFADRRRGFGDEGGGAPCPSEFVLHRAKRSASAGASADASANASANASREHPTQTGIGGVEAEGEAKTDDANDNDNEDESASGQPSGAQTRAEASRRHPNQH